MTKSFDEYYLTAEQIKRLLGHTIDTEPAASSRNTKTTKSAHQTGKPQTKEIEPKKEFANEAEYRERLRELGVPTYRELLNMMVEPLPGRKFAEPGYNVFSRYAREQKVFQVPNQEFVMALSEHLRGKRVLEIGSGNGYLAECLRACDVNIIATDNRSWQVAEDPPYQVENLDYQEALSKFGHQAEVIICVWMPRDQNWMPDMLEANPDEIIAIGELDWDGTYGNSRLIMRYVNNDDPNYYDEIKKPWVTYPGRQTVRLDKVSKYAVCQNDHDIIFTSWAASIKKNMINRNFEQEPTNTGNSRINEIVNRDREHKRFTANPINVYEKCFHQPQDELLQGAVLNIGDPFRVIARTHPDKNILTVDYYFPTPAEVFGDKVPERIRELDKITTDRCLEGPFPEATGQLPDRSFDRILAHAAMSMHSFEVYEDNEFRDLWQEAVRLLKEGGRFYIGPVQSDYGGAFDDQMVSTNIIPTLEVLAKSGLIEYRIVYGVHPYKNPSGDYQDGWVAESPDCIVIEKLGEDGECGLDDLFSAEKYEEVDNFGYSKRITPIVQLNL